jgi:competence ComEA-like helix-hairpin-helix protein
MRIEFLLVVLAAFALNLSACSQPKAVTSTYTPADCPCTKESAQVEKPQAESAGLAQATGESSVKLAVAEPAESSEEVAPAGTSAEKPVEEAGEKVAGRGVVNLNTATRAELMVLPGVGPALAGRIVEYRQQRSFKKPEHLMRVKGIGAATYAKLADMLTVDGATTATP